MRLAAGFGLSVVLATILAAILSGLLLRHARRPLVSYRKHLVRLHALMLRDLEDFSPEAVRRFIADNPDTEVAIYRDGRRSAGNLELPAVPDTFFQPVVRLDKDTLYRPWRGSEFTLTRQDGVEIVFAFHINLLQPLAVRILVLALAAIGIGFLLLFRYVRRLLAPIETLVIATERVHGGRLDYRIDAEASAVEFERLFAAFNRMAERLQAMFANDILLLGSISHDLRYYLTRLKMTVEVDVADETVKASFREDLDALDRYLERALEAFRSGSGQIETGNTTLDLSAWLRSCQTSMPDVTFNLVPDIRLPADEVALRAIFDNLLDNARRYGSTRNTPLSNASGKGANIRVTLTGTPQEWRLVISNRTDLAHEAENLSLLMQPFYRGDPARTSPGGTDGSARGTGLGLFIAKATADRLGLHFDLALQDGTFSVTLSGPPGVLGTVS